MQKLFNSKKKSKTTKELSNEDKIAKPYTQFSKKVVLMCVINLVVIEVFAMRLIWDTQDTSQLSFLITSIAVECLGCIIWYMKNSEAEKKARIQAEVDKLKHQSSMNDTPDTSVQETDPEPYDIPNYDANTLYDDSSDGPKG